jgi:hypothetical protein
MPLRLYRLRGRLFLLRSAFSRRATPLQPPSLRGAETQDPVTQLRRDGVAIAPALHPACVDSIYRYAVSGACHAWRGRHPFRITDIENGRLLDGTAVAVADVHAPEACPAVARTARDPALLAVAERYLGRPPMRVLPRLFWSPVSDLPDEERRRCGQTIDFHYDIEATRSLYLFYYIAGGTEGAGAHTVIPGSHLSKPLSMVFGRAFQLETKVLAHYGPGAPTRLEGAPGFGFFEDPACLHKATRPTTAPRLCLQLRYL